ncbi:MAG: leucine-rich repeat-containing protein kinase family protein [Leptodesmis sp.]|uniref:leucine-rich repeat-containing protein kinase family protein n=1 Tax=Leptodesmis sp. TaxID=3100501 RepID=UPI003D0B15BF
METLDLLRSGQLAGIKRLDLAAELTQFPPEILDLADSLEVLNLTNNRLQALPDELGRLKNLKIIFLSNNEFEELPEVLSDCPSLSMIGFKSNRIRTIAENALPDSIRWLILTDNQIEQLPATMGRLVNLQKLMLAGNRLRSLPDAMAACQNLELIRLSANCLPSLPSWLFTLPRLSWLAYSGNPFCEAMPASLERSLPDIDWAELTLGDTLGEGASGIISRGIWQTGPSDAVDVAVKVFKGNVTSDGLPADERNACLAAGTHNHLVNVLGKLINHPEEKAGLVFSFIPPNYKTLGWPPSLDSCTRDIYPQGTCFSWPVVLRIAQGMATAAAHLHARGIMHGDLYAHNILVNETGDSLLGDFGAASFYPASELVAGEVLEALEVRAFGCLLEDLLNHCLVAGVAEQKRYDRLRQLQQDCMNPIPCERPLFTKICNTLYAL